MSSGSALPPRPSCCRLCAFDVLEPGARLRYQMKQKLLSWGDDFYVRDEQGTDVYFVDGEDDVLILASAVVIDESCHPDAGRR